MNNIYAKIQEEISSFHGAELPQNPDYAPTQHDIVELIDLYWVDKFRDESEDSLGYKKSFYNIIEDPSITSSKSIDVDTKDIKFEAEDDQSYYPSWFLGKEFRAWARDKNFAKLLNDIVYAWPKYGTVVVKKVKGTIHLVPLQNLYCEPNVDLLKNSTYVIEKHDYTIDKLRTMPWDKKKIEEAIKEYGENGHVMVFERYGEVEDGKNYHIVAGKRDKYTGKKMSERDETLFTEIVLHSANIDFPYKELHWDKLNGRWLGRGVVEKLFEAQIHVNRIANYKAHGLHWTSKHIYNTRDSGVPRNILTDVEDGDILISNDEVTPIRVEERNLPAYREEETRWDRLVDRRTFSYDVMRGERAPAGTPLGSSMLQSRQAGGFFELKREDLGIFLREIIKEWIIGEFLKEKRKKHSIMMSSFDEDELDKLYGLLFNARINKSYLNFIRKKGRIPTKQEREAQKQILRAKLKTFKSIEIPKGFYENINYKIRIVITGEQVNSAVKTTAIQTVLQILGSNPTVLQSKGSRKLFFALLETIGISPTDFGEVEVTQPEEVRENIGARLGGSIARPQMATGPVTTKVSSAI